LNDWWRREHAARDQLIDTCRQSKDVRTWVGRCANCATTHPQILYTCMFQSVAQATCSSILRFETL
jgi:hypothetical protein